ncbi:MAG: thiamine-phosphate kinase, partial [Dissulfurimicrobium sp.]
EIDFISRLAQKAAAHGSDPDLMAGIGDDCALIRKDGGLLVVTTDTLVEGVHFDLAYFDPWHLGRKAAGVNLSDIAAMGAKPRWAFLNIASRPGLPSGFWDRFTDGLLSKLSAFGAVLAGGDTVSAPHDLSVTLTLIGEPVSGGQSGNRLRRSGARPGDIIYCSGYLGDAAAGLYYLRRYAHCDAMKGIVRGRCISRLVERHIDPEPRVGLGMALAASGLVCSAIDLSDGVATDLAHICRASGLGAELDASLLPISRAVRSVSRLFGLSPIGLAVSGGEDFELLWTVSAEDEQAMLRIAASALGHYPFRIGRMTLTGGSGVILRLNGRLIDITFCGYGHEI